MNLDTFRDMYLAELQELRSVEAQLVEALPNGRNGKPPGA
jgi:hypothetical protein